MNILKSQKVVFGLVLLAVMRLYEQFSLTHLFTCIQFIDALMVALPIIMGLGLSMHLLWSDFMTAKTWQAGLACAGGLYMGWFHMYWFFRLMDAWGQTVGFLFGGALFLGFALMGFITAAAFGWVLWSRLSVTLKQGQIQKEI